MGEGQQEVMVGGQEAELLELLPLLHPAPAPALFPAPAPTPAPVHIRPGWNYLFVKKLSLKNLVTRFSTFLENLNFTYYTLENLPSALIKFVTILRSPAKTFSYNFLPRNIWML
jgi:hypothetical protein